MGYKGVYYPGIKSEFDTFSVALTPDFVDTSLELDYAFEAIIYIKDGDYIIESQRMAKSNNGILDFNIKNSTKTQEEIEKLLDDYKEERKNNS